MITNLTTSHHSKRLQSNRSSEPSPSRRLSNHPQSTRTPSSPRTHTLSRPTSHSGTQRTDTKASPSLVSHPTLPSLQPDLELEPEGYRHMAEPISPTPTRKAPGAARRGFRVPRARGGPSRSKPTADEVEPELEVEAEADEEGDQDELFGLLGVISPPVKPVDTPSKAKRGEGSKGGENGRKGVLAISKADIEASGSKGGGKTAGRKDEAARPREGQREKGEGASGRAGAQTRSRAPQAETMPHSESDTPLTDTPRSRSSTPKPRQPKSRNSTKPPPQPGSAARPISGLSAQLAAHPSPSTIPNTASYGQAITPSTSSSSAFDTSALSRSLPSEALFAVPKDGHSMGNAREMGMMVPTQAKGSRGRKKKGGESEDESRIWDAPVDPGPIVAEDMTWQQRLGSYPNAEPSTSTTTTEYPRPAPSPNSTSSGKTKKPRPLPAPSPLNPSTSSSHVPSARPGHSRRSSADTLPTHTRHLSFPLQPSKPPPSAYPLSTFDTLPPFNPAMNVHRAPQTPAKGGLARKYAVMELPLLKGGFPRLNGEGGAGLGGSGGSGMGVGGSGIGGGGGGSLGTLGQGSNYAGASFHNSPHGRALPKPDMEDF